MEDLEYMKVYDLIINKKECKGIYLGQRFPKKRIKFRKEIPVKLNIQHVFLLNKPSKKPFENFSLKRFERYSFDKDGKLRLSYHYSIRIPRHQEWFYKKLLEEKIKE